MPTIRILALMAAVLFANAANALSPADGHISGHKYVNSYFHLSYTWPATLKPEVLHPQPAGNNGATVYAFPLFRAREGNQPYGVVVVAEKLHVASPHTTGFKSSADFINRIAHGLRPGPVLSNIRRSEKKNARGRVFEELSYRMNGKPASLMATQVGQYLIVFKCNAQSTSALSRMENSALGLRIFK